jgi:hypothetical protein
MSPSKARNLRLVLLAGVTAACAVAGILVGAFDLTSPSVTSTNLSHARSAAIRPAAYDPLSGAIGTQEATQEAMSAEEGVISALSAVLVGSESFSQAQKQLSAAEANLRRSLADVQAALDSDATWQSGTTKELAQRVSAVLDDLRAAEHASSQASFVDEMQKALGDMVSLAEVPDVGVVLPGGSS